MEMQIHRVIKKFIQIAVAFFPRYFFHRIAKSLGIDTTTNIAQKKKTARLRKSKSPAMLLKCVL